MRRINVWVLLSAAILFLGTVITAQPAAALQGQNSFPEAFRVIGNIYWVGGEYGSYLITAPQGHILLDTGSTEMHDVIVSNVKRLGFKVEDIKIMISSHAHWDHVQGHAAMKKLTGALVVALGGDAAALEAGQDNSAGGFRGMIAVHVDRVIKDGDTVSLDGTTLRALWTPGHTQGSISLLIPAENKLVAGDTLFLDSIGRTDLPGGDHRQILRSIHDKLLPLDDRVVVIPGHGSNTTIGRERHRNPFLQGL